MGSGQKNKRQRRIKIFLLLAIIIILVAVAAIFMNYRHTLNQAEKIVSVIKDEASISIDKVHQTATRDGITEWTLDAGSVQYMNEKKEVVFQDISVTFFPESKKEARLTADQGLLKTDSNNIEVSGNVVLENEEYRLRTQRLCYEYENRIFSSDVPVKLRGFGFDLAADSMSLDLETTKTLFKGNVRGTLIQNITL